MARYAASLSFSLCVVLCAACGSTAATGGSAADATAGDAAFDVAPADTADVAADASQTVADVQSKDADDIAAADVAAPDSGPKLGCGDKLCTSPETSVTCPGDCAKPVCGDGFCQKPESGMTCELDCAPVALAEVACMKKLCPAAVAACSLDPVCADILGTALSCAGDANGDTGQLEFCGTNLGNNAKSKPLTDASCGFASCAGKTEGAVCGDGVCQPSESSAGCIYDCVGVAGKCGDGACGPGETSASCPADCASSTVCGNGKCEVGELYSNCPADCPFVAVCGDGTCDKTEDATSCALDCDAALKPKTDCLKASCGGEYDACMAEAACVKAITAELQCISKCAFGDILCPINCQKSTGNTNAAALASCGGSNCS